VRDEQFHIDRIRNARDHLKKRRIQLIDQINTVFRHVSRDGGISIREAHVIDDYGSDEERQAARAEETDSHWSDVDVENLDPGGSALSFVDPIGFRYYLPAYMVYTLKSGYGDALGEENVDSNVFESTIFKLNASASGDQDCIDHQRERFALFTSKERTCIARFLAFDAECRVFDYEVGSIEALKSDWIDALPHMELKHLKTIWPEMFD
jgi:uncharacterized protein DUF6714